MPEVAISYIQKNGSTQIGREVIQSDHIPKVGELIYNRTMFQNTGGEGFVTCVAHEVVNDKIKHHIVAHAGHQIPGEEDFNHYDLLRFIDFEN